MDGVNQPVQMKCLGVRMKPAVLGSSGHNAGRAAAHAAMWSWLDSQDDEADLGSKQKHPHPQGPEQPLISTVFNKFQASENFWSDGDDVPLVTAGGGVLDLHDIMDGGIADQLAEPETGLVEPAARESLQTKLVDLLLRPGMHRIVDFDRALDIKSHAWTQVLLQAIAYSSNKLQIAYLQRVLLFSVAWAETNTWKPFLAIWKVKYDETPLRIKVAFPSTDVQQGGGQKNLDPQTSKVHVIDSSWTLVFKDASIGEGEASLASRFKALQGHFAAQCRVTDRGNGEAIAAVLQQCHAPPEEITVFPRRVRVVESDALGANGRGERLLAAKATWSKDMWPRFISHCCAHKVHKAATSCFDLMPSLVTGLKNVCLLMASPGILAEFRKQLGIVVQQKFQLLHGVPRLTQSERQYRHEVLRVFQPQRVKAKIIVLKMSQMLNGDWKLPVSTHLTHWCSGCCESHDNALNKTLFLLNKMLSSCRPELFSVSNWDGWPRSLVFVGLFGAVHSLLHEVMSVVLASGLTDCRQPVPAEAPDETIGQHNVIGATNEGAEPAMDAERAAYAAKMSERKEKTASFLELPMAVDRCFLLLQALKPQQYCP
eukprot:1310632-Amphidinium_carterae.2